MANSMATKRIHFTHFAAPSRKMKFKTIKEREDYLARKRHKAGTEEVPEVKQEAENAKKSEEASKSDKPVRREKRLGDILQA